MSVYFEQITLANLGAALFALLRRRHVYYFSLGRFTRKMPLLNVFLTRWFRLARYEVSEFEGLFYEIHNKAIETAEQLHTEVTKHNAMTLSLWRNTFRNELVHLYVKKTVAMAGWFLIRDYLLLHHRIRRDDEPTELVVLDSPMNRMLVPTLFKAYPETRLKVSGLSRFPWSCFHGALGILLIDMEVAIRLFWSALHRRLVLRTVLSQYTVSKEIKEGIGIIGTDDDFVVDGSKILPEEFLLYYRRNSPGRQPHLNVSIANGMAKGYDCVDFDRIPLPVALIWNTILPRYIIFPLLITVLTLGKNLLNPSASLLNQIIMPSLQRIAGWEVFSASYAPRLNLTRDDPYPHHILDTIGLNLHGCQNGGFQFADVTQYRVVTLAYVGYNTYFSWGSLPQAFWKGNWVVDHWVTTGYLWGHHCQENLEKRDVLSRKLLNDDNRHKNVVALLDEGLDPDLPTSAVMFYDFYRVGVQLLERRPDTIVIAKPKRFEMPYVPEVVELISPYVKSGRLKVWEKMTTNVHEVIAISDVVVSLIMGVPYLEATCCGKIGFNFAPTRNYASPIYTRAYGKTVFDQVDELVEAIEKVLEHPEDNPWTGMNDLLDDVDPFRDSHGIDRMRAYIHETFGKGSASDPQSSEAGRVGQQHLSL